MGIALQSGYWGISEINKDSDLMALHRVIVEAKFTANNMAIYCMFNYKTDKL